MKNIRVFHWKILSFLEMKFSIYLNRRVFVMPLICCYDNYLEMFYLNSDLSANMISSAISVKWKFDF